MQAITASTAFLPGLPSASFMDSAAGSGSFVFSRLQRFFR